MAYQLTADDIKKSLIGSGISVPEKQRNPSLLEKAGNIAGKFNEAVESSGLPNLSAHLLSAPLHAAANVANVPGEIANKFLDKDIPKVEVPGYIDPINSPGLRHTPTTEAMGFAGDVLGDLISGGGAYKGAENALKLGSKAPLALRSLLGGVSGAAITDPEQLGGRTLGFGLSASAPALSGLSSSTIGKRAAQMSTENSKKYEQLYNKLLGDAEKSGASKEFKLPSMLKENSEDLKKFFKHTESQKNASVNRLMTNPNIENAHKAQSDIGKIIRKLEVNRIKEGGLSSGQHDALEIARNLQKRIRGSMQDAFTKVNRNDLGTKYSDITKGYGEEVAPLKNVDIKKLLAGKISSGKAGKRLIESEKFSESGVSKQIPGYKARKTLHDIPTWAKTLGAASTLPALSSLGVPIPYYLRKLLGE